MLQSILVAFVKATPFHIRIISSDKVPLLRGVRTRASLTAGRTRVAVPAERTEEIDKASKTSYTEEYVHG